MKIKYKNKFQYLVLLCLITLGCSAKNNSFSYQKEVDFFINSSGETYIYADGQKRLVEDFNINKKFSTGKKLSEKSFGDIDISAGLLRSYFPNA